MANPNTSLITADTLDVTKFTGWGAAVAALTSSVVAVVAKLHHQPEAIVVALIAFAAVALVVIWRGGDRRHARPTRPCEDSHAHQGNDPAVPLTYQIWQELRPDLEKAGPSLDVILKEALAARAAGSVARANGHSAGFKETIEIEPM